MQKRRIKAAIFADTAPTFVRPVAEGLQRMFGSAGQESKIFYSAHKNLYISKLSTKKTILRNLISVFKWIRSFIFLLKIIPYNPLIVVAHLPGAFMRSNLNLVEVIRKIFPRKVIVLYDLAYLPTATTNSYVKWYQWLRNGNPNAGIPIGNNFGMERFDYYLIVSPVTENPLPQCQQPAAFIGINMQAADLYPEQKNKFVALVDFQRDTNPEERAIILRALDQTQTPYRELIGSFSLSEIRAIYRQSSIYFIMHRESFGLPICELQACGSFIFTPYPEWVPAHHLKNDLSLDTQGTLPENFIVYHNDLQFLKQKIEEVKKNSQPQTVLESYKKNHSQFYTGNLGELKKFIELYQNGTITPQSHNNYKNINDLIL